jgi:hypothetical protein
MTTYKLSLPNDYGSEEDESAMQAAGDDYMAIADAANAAGMKYLEDSTYGALWAGTDAQFAACVEALPAWAKRYASKVED